MSFTGATALVNAAVSVLSFRPGLNFMGDASLTVQTSDRGATGTGGTLTDEDVIVIEVVPGNDPPDAVNDTLTIAEDAALTRVAVLGNDTGLPDLGETLTIIAVSTPLHGAATIDGNQVTYQPATNYAAPTALPTRSATVTAARTRPASRSPSRAATTRRTPRTIASRCCRTRRPRWAC